MQCLRISTRNRCGVCDSWCRERRVVMWHAGANVSGPDATAARHQTTRIFDDQHFDIEGVQCNLLPNLGFRENVSSFRRSSAGSCFSTGVVMRDVDEPHTCATHVKVMKPLLEDVCDACVNIFFLENKNMSVATLGPWKVNLLVMKRLDGSV